MARKRPLAVLAHLRMESLTTIKSKIERGSEGRRMFSFWGLMGECGM